MELIGQNLNKHQNRILVYPVQRVCPVIAPIWVGGYHPFSAVSQNRPCSILKVTFGWLLSFIHLFKQSIVRRMVENKAIHLEALHPLEYHDLNSIRVRIKMELDIRYQQTGIVLPLLYP